MKNKLDRRDFVKKTVSAGIGVGLGVSVRPAHSRPAETVRVAVMGVNSRGSVLAAGFAAAPDSEVAYICDVDRTVRERVADALIAAPEDGNQPSQQTRPTAVNDFRRALDDPDVDALVIAAPDHWHAPAALMALQAGKHVYVEKPCGHNPAEGEMLVDAQRRYNRLVQMGNQQRSAPESIELIEAIRSGLIGRPYLAWAWYANTRGTIGTGTPAAVPDNLDWDLWQGPAPRTTYKNNYVHYDWHWFQNWGTGEICNNGTHEIDMARWALGVDFPVRVNSAGGRYHFNDDWEFPDSQIANFEFENGSMITWNGRSCNGMPVHDRGRGVTIHADAGSAILDRNGYVVYDLDNKEIMRHTRSGGGSALDLRGAGRLTDHHIQNFLGAIRGQNRLNSPIEDGHKSVLLCHLGNIAHFAGEALNIDPKNGRLSESRHLNYWSRSYEPGWEMKLD